MAHEKDPLRKDDQTGGRAKAPDIQPDTDTPDHLGPSDHEGEPRMYGENAIDALKDDPLPEGKPAGSKKSSD